MSEVKEKVEKTVEEVKETVNGVKETIKDVKETAKEVVDKTKETVAKGTAKVIETTKAKSWWNRIWSAIVGAVLAVAAMFGITTDKVAHEKALVTQVKQYAEDALADIKNGNLTEAAKKLEQANAIGKNVVEDVKDTAEKIKDADKTEVKDAALKGAKDGLLNPKAETSNKNTEQK